MPPPGRARDFASSLAAAGLALTAHAAAAPPDETVSFRLRASAGYPLGRQDHDHDLSDTYALAVPFDLEVGYWLNPRLLLGAHGSFGPLGISSAACPEPISCSGTQLQLGAVVEYRFDPDGRFREWGSAGIGYERARIVIEDDGRDASRSDGGPAATLQFGGDFPFEGGFSAGPFAGALLGQYVHASLRQGDGRESTYRIISPTLHAWLVVGARGVWSP